MNPISIGILSVLLIYIIKKSLDKNLKRIPICYHCESKDTLGYHRGNFYCVECGKIIDYDYVISKYPDDARYVMLGEKYYNSYKKERGVK